jgi:hypothetical protein
MNQEEVTPGTSGTSHMVASGFTGMMVRGNRGSDYSSTSAGELGSDERNALNVLVAIIRGESELCGCIWLVLLISW